MQASDDDLTLLLEAAEAAGDIALRHFAGDRKSWQKPGGHGPLTDADLEIDEMLRTRLLAARPDYGWLSEETPDDQARLARDRVFIVDPIDGTRSFVEGGRSFAHSLAVVERGEVIAGVVMLPALGRSYSAARGRGAFVDGTPLKVGKLDEIGAESILISKGHLEPTHWPGGVPPLERYYRASFANRLALVAEGRFDALASFRDAWEWDIAAGALILTEAGGAVSAGQGEALKFNSPGAQQPGILAANPILHRQLLARHHPGAA